jgi:hypothetical protein
MHATEAAEIIEAMASSYRDNPTQFHFSVSVKQVGTSVQVSGGGVGLQVSATGGGAGSRTVGFSSSASSGSIDASVVRQVADAEIQQQAATAIALFDALTTELRKSQPQKSAIQGALSRMAGAMLPPLVVATIKVLLAKIGIDA